MQSQGLSLSPTIPYTMQGKIPFQTMLTKLGRTTVQETKLREIIREGLWEPPVAINVEGRVVRVGRFGDLVGHRWFFSPSHIEALRAKVGLGPVPARAVELPLAEPDCPDGCCGACQGPEVCQGQGACGSCEGTECNVEAAFQELLGEESDEEAPEDRKVSTAGERCAVREMNLIRACHRACQSLGNMSVTRQGPDWKLFLEGEPKEDQGEALMDDLWQGLLAVRDIQMDIQTLLEDPQYRAGFQGDTTKGGSFVVQIRVEDVN